MIILLDFDGVLITTPPWKKVETHSDGFLEFNSAAATNLMRLIEITGAEVILTTTHRIIFSTEQWLKIFNGRGFNLKTISKINSHEIYEMKKRGAEVEEWANIPGYKTNYVIIDDDPSISTLPPHITQRWVKTNPTVGFDNNAFEKAIAILKLGII